MSKRLWRNKAGGSAMEFALLAPLFLMVVLATVEFCRAMWTWHVLEFAVEEAARYALVHTTASETEISAYAAQRLGTVSTTPATITTTLSLTTTTITADYQFQFKVPVLLPFGPLPLQASSTFPR